MKKKFKINEKAVRSALTTLQKNGCVKQVGWRNEDFANDRLTLIVNVSEDLITTKKKFQSDLKKIDKHKKSYLL